MPLSPHLSLTAINFRVFFSFHDNSQCWWRVSCSWSRMFRCINCRHNWISLEREQNCDWSTGKCCRWRFKFENFKNFKLLRKTCSYDLRNRQESWTSFYAKRNMKQWAMAGNFFILLFIKKWWKMRKRDDKYKRSSGYFENFITQLRFYDFSLLRSHNSSFFNSFIICVFWLSSHIALSRTCHWLYFSILLLYRSRFGRHSKQNFYSP